MSSASDFIEMVNTNETFGGLLDQMDSDAYMERPDYGTISEVVEVDGEEERVLFRKERIDDINKEPLDVKDTSDNRFLEALEYTDRSLERLGYNGFDVEKVGTEELEGYMERSDSFRNLGFVGFSTLGTGGLVTDVIGSMSKSSWLIGVGSLSILGGVGSLAAGSYYKGKREKISEEIDKRKLKEEMGSIEDYEVELV